MDFSSIEKELYEFIEKNTEVTIKMIREQLSEKYVGALGKLIQGNEIEKYKKKGEKSFGYKMVTYYGIKFRIERVWKGEDTDVSAQESQN